MARKSSSSRAARCVAAAALGTACWNVSWAALDFAFAGVRPTGRPTPQTSLNYNIFEGVQSLFPSGGEEVDPDEVGTRSQRAVDSNARLVECDLPLGVVFEEKDGGDIYVKDVDDRSSAWRQGVRPGAQLTMISATFGDEMWTARKVGLTQFYTVLNSRFGSTIRLALEKENQSLLSNLFSAAMPKAPPLSQAEQEKKSKDLGNIFEREEKKLEGKGMWNPFR